MKKKDLTHAQRLERMQMLMVQAILIDKALCNVGIEGVSFN